MTPKSLHITIRTTIYRYPYWGMETRETEPVYGADKQRSWVAQRDGHGHPDSRRIARIQLLLTPRPERPRTRFPPRAQSYWRAQG
jgi:hypothetical protein